MTGILPSVNTNFMIKSRLTLVFVFQALWVTTGLATGPLAPSHEIARQNSFHIFNSIHSAMRQWGSSLNHNGMALIPATVPRGSLFYHGTHRNLTAGPPPGPGPEWLAFEIEHSETFAFSIKSNDSLPNDYAWDKLAHANPDNQIVLGRLTNEGIRMSSEKAIRGYLHTYQANRDLKLLYVDGMSAGKSDMGMLDTQDLLLRTVRNISEPLWDERNRAADLCKLVSDWGYDGIIRMEIGFEIIYCNFSSGLDLFSLLRRPFFDQLEGEIEPTRRLFQFARAITHRYEGFDSNRVKLDFSRMVSAYFYPINLTNPDPKADELPRLLSTTSSEQSSLRSRVVEVNTQTTSALMIEWQSIVDMIVSRYGDRLALMKSLSVDPNPDVHNHLAQEIYQVTNTHFEYPETPEDTNSQQNSDREGEARGRCISHYLQPAESFKDLFTQEDSLIYTAIKAVMTRICETLFESRALIQKAQLDLLPLYPEKTKDLHDKLQVAINRSRRLIVELTDDLQWTDWKKCGRCAVDEICFVAMWPYGRPVDHYHPSCVDETNFEDPLGNNYWFPNGIPGNASRYF